MKNKFIWIGAGLVLTLVIVAGVAGSGSQLQGRYSGATLPVDMQGLADRVDEVGRLANATNNKARRIERQITNTSGGLSSQLSSISTRVGVSSQGQSLHESLFSARTEIENIKRRIGYATSGESLHEHVYRARLFADSANHNTEQIITQLGVSSWSLEDLAIKISNECN